MEISRKFHSFPRLSRCLKRPIRLLKEAKVEAYAEHHGGVFRPEAVALVRPHLLLQRLRHALYANGHLRADRYQPFRDHPPFCLRIYLS